MTPTNPLLGFQQGVILLESKSISLFVSRVPSVLATPGALTSGETTDQQSSDLRRIDYWLAAGGGLCRKERPWVTADGTGTSGDIDRSTEAMDVIAETVTDVTFSVPENISTTDGLPPRAVKVTLTFETPSPRGGDPIVRTVSQVFAVRTAPGTNGPVLVDPVVPENPPEDPAGGMMP
jgi:hypothetical protein